MKKGFMLIEMVIAVGIMTIIVYTMMSLTSNAVKNTRGMQLTLDFLQLQSEASMITFYPATCNLAIGGQPFVPSKSTYISYRSASGTIISNGTVYNGLRFNRVSLDDLGVVAGFPNQYVASLTFTAMKTGAFSGPPILTRSIPLKLVIAGGVVQNCFSFADMSLASVCASFMPPHNGVFDVATQTCTLN